MRTVFTGKRPIRSGIAPMGAPGHGLPDIRMTFYGRVGIPEKHALAIRVSGIDRVPHTPDSDSLRGWNCTKYSRQRRHVQRDLPLRTPQRGSGKSEQSQ
jgi:hypothetical protein